MHPIDKQRTLAAKYLLIADPQERLTALMDRGRKALALADAERTDGNRVQGCVSRVWLIGELRDGECHFRIDADSALVKGLALAVCEVYDGAAPAEAAEFETTILETLQLADQLSPTRRHGLHEVGQAIRRFARANALPAA
jgi:cysteine desulfuration protein SufE